MDDQTRETLNALACRPVPLSECVVPWWRRLLAWLPGFCGYCGRRYVNTVGVPLRRLSLPMPGRGCPNGHEGYVDHLILMGFGGVQRERYDYVRDGDPGPIDNDF